MGKQGIVNAYGKMRQDISNNKDKYLEKIFKYVKVYFSTDKSLWSWETFYPYIETLIYNSLEETYGITIKAAKEIYGIKFKETIDEETLEDLTYSKDGKSLEERIKEHYEEAVKKDNPTLYFYNRIVLIMDTETSYATNHVIHGKVKKYATHVEILEQPECMDEPGSECEYWVLKGKMPIEELEELPPYHPDCDCQVIYYIDKEKIKEKEKEN